MENSFKYFNELNATLSDFMSNVKNDHLVEEVVKVCINAFAKGNAVYFCGNGGSAAEAMHLAAEFSGRYKMERKPLKSDFIAANTSFLTAVSNDYGYQHVFSRGIEAVGIKGDVLFLLSTSGNSENIVNAVQKARELGIVTISLTGESGGKLADISDYLLKVPSSNTPRIQEVHLLLGHIICEEVEKRIFAS